MSFMRAVVLRGPHQLAVEEVPRPQPRPDEVICRVHACGICGSDLRYLAGENPWAKHTLGVDRPNPPNMILGHEVAGTVLRNGGQLRVGILAFVTCGDCPECRAGRSQLCRNTRHLGHGAGWDDRDWNPGGMAEFVPVWRDNLYPLPEHISFAAATFLDGLGVAVHAVNRAAIEPGGGVVVLGAGPIGLLLLQVARARGSGPVLATDVYDAALVCARELGAELVLDGRELSPEDLVGEVARWAGGDRIAAVFDTTGDLRLQQAGLRMLAPGGTLMLMAGAAPGLVVSGPALAGERVVTTASNNLRADFEAGLNLLCAGAVVVEPMITHRFDLSDAVKAFDVAARKQQTGAIKVIILP